MNDNHIHIPGTKYYYSIMDMYTHSDTKSIGIMLLILLLLTFSVLVANNTKYTKRKKYRQIVQDAKYACIKDAVNLMATGFAPNL